MQEITPKKIPDPVEDREEFKRRLNGIFDIEVEDPRFTKSAIKAILLDDPVEKAKFVAKIQESDSKIDGYLAGWDGAINKAGRQAVVSSVRKD